MENKWNDKAILAAVRQRVIDKLDVAGKFVEDSAKLLVAVDTGNLRGSITHKVDEQELSCRIGTNVEYAPYLEFGTGEFAENGQGRKGGWFFTDADGKTHFTLGNKPQPFLRPALLENKAAIKKMLEL
jgi:HK97 gp10 family phage protein